MNPEEMDGHMLRLFWRACVDWARTFREIGRPHAWTEMMAHRCEQEAQRRGWR